MKFTLQNSFLLKFTDLGLLLLNGRVLGGRPAGLRLPLVRVPGRRQGGTEAGRTGAGLPARGQRCALPSAAVWGCSTPHPWSCLVGEFTRLLRPPATAACRWGMPGCASCPAHGPTPHLRPSAVSPALIPFSLSRWLSVLLFLLFSVLVGTELFTLFIIDYIWGIFPLIQ